jgi:selenocysteine lyase/cysteine desulfurase
LLDEPRSIIVIWKSPRMSVETTMERLTAAGVRCAARGGGIRFSPHFYNTSDDVQSALAVL